MTKIMLACRCGWQGYQDELISEKHAAGGDSKRCPDCNRPFRSWPVEMKKGAPKSKPAEALAQLLGK